LAKRKTVRVAVDSALAAERLSAAAAAAGSTIGLLVDLDVGFHRTGVSSPSASLDLARKIASLKHVRLDGIFLFPGHIFSPPDQQKEQLAAVAATLEQTLSLWKRDGLAAPIVSGGSTPTARQSHTVAGLTEIRPGTYAYYDANCVAGRWCTMDECAAHVVCTVVSTAVSGKCVIDAGTKTLTSDRRFDAPDTAGYGHVVELPDAKIVRLTEEHGEIDLHGQPPPPLGSRLKVIPNHICPCVNLHDRFWFREADGSLTQATVDTRGRVQ